MLADKAGGELESAPGPRPLGRARDWLVGGVLLLALVGVVQVTVGWGALLAPWRALSPSALLGMAALAVASLVLRAWRFYDYYRPAYSGCFATFLRLTAFHNAANNLLPMRSGELVFPWLMRRYFRHGLLDATGALLWIRALDLHLLGLVGLAILYLREPLWLWLGAAGIWLFVLVGLPFVGRYGRAPRAGAAQGRLWTAVLRIAAAAPTRPQLVTRLYLWTALIWLLKIAAFAMLLRHFVPIELWRVIAGVLSAELSSVLPFHGVGGTGTYELAAVAALVPLGVEPALALTGAVNLHLFLLGVTLLLAALAPFLRVCRPP